MGVDIGDLCEKKPISLDSLEGKVIAVDAFNFLYQFLASIRQEDGTPLMDDRGRITGHLSGLFYRTVKLVENGIKPVYVFDGMPTVMKEETRRKRQEAKKSAMEKWKKALEEKRIKDAKKYAMATSKLTPEMVEESKLLLEGLGIPYVQAPSEGEAQAAVMAKEGIVHAVASQDYDALLFGSPILVRNISITGRRKVPRQDRYIMVQPEEMVLRDILKSLKINQKKLIYIGILTGTDFNEGVRRVGPKTALKIVTKEKNLDSIIKHVKEKYEYEFEVDVEKLVDFFLDPPCEEVKGKFRWGKVDSAKVEKLLVEEHDFSEDRVSRTLERAITAFAEKGAQKKLGDWF